VSAPTANTLSEFFRASISEKEENKGRVSRAYINPNIKEASENAGAFSEGVAAEEGGEA